MVTDPSSGQTLAGRYRIGEPVGVGATSEVCSAFDLLLERPVAIKFLRAGLATDAELRRHFETEARTAARLCHPNVVAVFDTANPEPPGRPYIVMEHVDGPTLRRRLAGGPLPEAEVRELGLEILSALDRAVALDLVHCDIKPANIMAAANGWKLADFGAAWPLHAVGQPKADCTGAVTGTPAYMAPELVLGRPASPASDLFSVGVVLYEALTGQRPFETFGAPPWTTAAAGRRAIPVGVARPGTDPVLAAVIDRAVRPDPGDRFATPAAMMAALAPADPPAAALRGAPLVPAVEHDRSRDTVEVRVIAGRVVVPAGRLAAPARRALGGGMAAAATIVVGVLALSGQLSAARAGDQAAPVGRPATTPVGAVVHRPGPTTTVEPIMASTVAAVDPQPTGAQVTDPGPVVTTPVAAVPAVPTGRRPRPAATHPSHGAVRHRPSRRHPRDPHAAAGVRAAPSAPAPPSASPPLYALTPPPGGGPAAAHGRG